MELRRYSTVLRQKVPQPRQESINEENIYMWEESDLMDGLEYWMKTPTTNKLISVTVANEETRDLPNHNEASVDGMAFPDIQFYDCQAHALRTWIPTEMVVKGEVKEGTRQGYRIRLECLWDVLHDSELATVIYEELNPAKANVSDIKANDLIVFWKPQLRDDHGRDGVHAAIILTPEVHEGKLTPNTNLSTKNGIKPVEIMTIEQLRARQSGYFKDGPVIGVYRLTQATSFA